MSLSLGPLPSSQDHSFAVVPKAEIPRSVFDRSHAYKTAFNSGYLIPFLADEALPGDTFNVNTTMIARLATPLTPFMDNLYADTFYFSVPLRLIWDNFQKFMGEQDNPTDSTSFSIPQMVAPASTGWVVESLSDYLGLPIGIPGISVMSLYHRAYNLCWNTWFRDENLQNSVTVDKGNGPDNSSNYVLLKRGKRHDYFTSALPAAQKGTAINLPLSGTAPVTSPYNMSGVNYSITNGGANTQMFTWGQTVENSGFVADLSTATASTINSLRQAFQLQRMLERDMRGGTRYIEKVKAHFNVDSPDLRATRPVFLGGSSSPVMITPITQTSATGLTGGGAPLGHLAAAGTLAHSDGFVHSFTEHCIILGLVSVRADLTYQQGIPRKFSRLTQYDFYWPALANLGEQSVLNKEIYAVATTTPGDAGDLQNNAVFGYQERFAEYRYFPSQITGKLRSTYSTPLDMWHLAQKFTSLPTLSTTFIAENPPVDRVVAVTNEPQFIMDSFIKMRCARPMPVFSVPGLMDHF